MKIIYPKKLYRFFSKEQYALDFLAGRIRLSTLNTCKTLSNEQGRDEWEGFATGFLKNETVTSSTNDELRENLKIARITDVKNDRVSTFTNCTIGVIHKDEHLICFSKNPSDYIMNNFGAHGVEIFNVKALFDRIHKAKKIDPNYEGSWCNDVFYNDHEVDLKSRDAFKVAGMLKRERFKQEEEFRMIIYSKKYTVFPEFIEVGNLNDAARIYKSSKSPSNTV